MIRYNNEPNHLYNIQYKSICVVLPVPFAKIKISSQTIVFATWPGNARDSNSVGAILDLCNTYQKLISSLLLITGHLEYTLKKRKHAQIRELSTKQMNVLSEV